VLLLLAGTFVASKAESAEPPPAGILTVSDARETCPLSASLELRVDQLLGAPGATRARMQAAGVGASGRFAPEGTAHRVEIELHGARGGQRTLSTRDAFGPDRSFGAQRVGSARSIFGEIGGTWNMALGEGQGGGCTAVLRDTTFTASCGGTDSARDGRLTFTLREGHGSGSSEEGLEISAVRRQPFGKRLADSAARVPSLPRLTICAVPFVAALAACGRLPSAPTTEAGTAKTQLQISSRPVSRAAANGDETESNGVFPSMDEATLAALPPEVRFDDPARVSVFTETDGNNIGDALPVFAALRRRNPAFTVIVLDRSGDSKLRSWIHRERLLLLDPTDSSLPRRLRAISAKLSVGNAQSASSGVSGRHHADRIQGESPNVYVFVGRRLVWRGDESDAKAVVEQAVRGLWSGQLLAEDEAVLAEIRRLAQLWLGGDSKETRPALARFAERARWRLGGIADLAMLIAQKFQDPTDADLARRLADNVLRETEELDGGMLRDAAFVHYMTGDNAGAMALSEKWLKLCRVFQSDCSSEFLNRVRMCPLVLHRVDGHYTAVSPPGLPPECY
jgi:hypothetical protein